MCLFAWAAAGTALVAASCKGRSSGAAPDPSAGEGASAASTAPASSAKPLPTDDESDDEVQAVYPVDKQPPDPFAERYCDAVQEGPRKRREACCPDIGAFAPTAECVRTLSAALRAGAVSIDPAGLDACRTAVEVATSGCDWVRPVGGAPAVPACLGIIRGNVKEGARCRSSLECEGELRCRGLGATHAGKCARADDAHYCNVSADSLAAWTEQKDIDRRHPDCAGYCVSGRCAPAAAPGAPCTDSVQCGTKAWCIAGKCAEGPLPGPGAACTDLCAEGSRCAKGKCLATKAEGAACQDSTECRVHCERGDAAPGTCAGVCPSFPKTPWGADAGGPTAPRATGPHGGPKR
jgi:hypothetical protein